MTGLSIHGSIEIEIGGKKRGFRFGMWLLMKLAERNEGMSLIDFINLGKTNPLKYFGELLYLGAYHHNTVNKLPIDFDEIEVYDWIDLNSEELAKLVHCFNDSISFNGKTLMQIAEEEVPKKKTITKPKPKRKPTGKA